MERIPCRRQTRGRILSWYCRVPMYVPQNSFGVVRRHLGLFDKKMDVGIRINAIVVENAVCRTAGLQSLLLLSKPIGTCGASTYISLPVSIIQKNMTIYLCSVQRSEYRCRPTDQSANQPVDLSTGTSNTRDCRFTISVYQPPNNPQGRTWPQTHRLHLIDTLTIHRKTGHHHRYRRRHHHHH